jgi:hypothetical protein
MHTLIVIGYLGIKRAYLDIPMHEAIRRYGESESIADLEDSQLSIKEFEFKDEFGVYDAYGI